MGFEVQETLVDLVFTDPSFKGLEVTCAVVPIGELTAAASLAQVDPKNIKPEDLAKVDQLVSTFASSLRSWNLTRKGRKVPATKAGVSSLDLVFALQIVTAWLSGVGQVVAQQAMKDMDHEEFESGIPATPL